MICINIANTWDTSKVAYVNRTYTPAVLPLPTAIKNLTDEYYFLRTALRAYSSNL
jgi:hypothetical protein